MHERGGRAATRVDVWTVDGGAGERRSDELATEEPLEIRLQTQPPVAPGPGPEERSRRQTVCVTMRTPGHDLELAAGFLFAEWIVHEREDIWSVHHCAVAAADPEQPDNVVVVELRPGLHPDLGRLERWSYASSACGVCGKASLEGLRLRGCRALPPGPVLAGDVLRRLPERLRRGQQVFEATGGLHAAALFDLEGALLAVREDVGRHNAVDKLVGWALEAALLPLDRHILMVSGRTSFEILQKAVTAGLPVVCAVSAPSSLAVTLAREFNVTLVGFLRGERFNVYAGPERIVGAADRGAPDRAAEAR